MVAVIFLKYWFCILLFIFKSVIFHFYLMIKCCNFNSNKFFVEACLFATALMSKWEIDWKYMYSILYWMCFQNHIVILSLLNRALLFSCEWFPIKRSMLKLCFIFLLFKSLSLVCVKKKILWFLPLKPFLKKKKKWISY